METVEQVKMRIQRLLAPDRLAHSYGVAKEAQRLAGMERTGSGRIMRGFAMIFARICRLKNSCNG